MAVSRWLALFLALGLLAASQSGNIIRLAAAPAVAIAAWRLLLASAFLAPLAGARLRSLRALAPKELVLLALAGVLLAGHFITWIAAVQHTTVANASVFFSINPVFTTFAARGLFGERVSPRLVGTMLVGLLGVALIGVGDLRLSPEHLLGDALAVACSLLFTAYFMAGKRLRRTLDNRVYVTALYAVAAGVCFFAMALTDLPLADYDAQTWVAFALMALLPTALGHTSLNYALRYLEAGKISALTLSEPLLAGAVAYFAWGEQPRPHTLAGYALICASVLLVVREGPPAGEPPS